MAGFFFKAAVPGSCAIILVWFFRQQLKTMPDIWFVVAAYLLFFFVKLYPELDDTVLLIAVLLYLLISCLSLGAAFGIKLAPICGYICQTLESQVRHGLPHRKNFCFLEGKSTLLCLFHKGEIGSNGILLRF